MYDLLESSDALRLHHGLETLARRSDAIKAEEVVDVLGCALIGPYDVGPGADLALQKR